MLLPVGEWSLGSCQLRSCKNPERILPDICFSSSSQGISWAVCERSHALMTWALIWILQALWLHWQLWTNDVKAVYCTTLYSTVRLSNFDRQDAKMEAFLESTEVFSADIFLMKSYPRKPPCRHHVHGRHGHGSPVKNRRRFLKFCKNTKL